MPVSVGPLFGVGGRLRGSSLCLWEGAVGTEAGPSEQGPDGGACVSGYCHRMGVGVSEGRKKDGKKADEF